MIGFISDKCEVFFTKLYFVDWHRREVALKPLNQLRSFSFVWNRLSWSSKKVSIKAARNLWGEVVLIILDVLLNIVDMERDA